MKKYKFEHGRDNLGPRQWLKSGLLAASMGLLLAAPALAAEPAAPADEQAKTTATTVCVACHGEEGNSVVPMFPKLAGMTREYLAKQLTEFMSGKRKNDMMSPIAANLKPTDVAPLAAYYGNAKPKPAPVPATPDAKLVEEGKQLFMNGNETTGVPACGGCHGQDAAGVALVPRLAGQYSDYLIAQLKSFNAGTRTNDPNRFMRVVSQRMTEQEMKAVAEYLSSLEVK